MKDGLYIYCKECKIEEARLYRESEIGKKYLAEYRVSENKKISNARFKRSHKGRLAAARYRARYNKSPEGRIAIAKYFNSEAGKLAILRSGYRRRRRMHFATKGVVSLTAEDWKDVLGEYNYSCAYCGDSETKLTVDHVVPISKGGKHTKDNVVPACVKCNATKSDKKWKPLPILTVLRLPPNPARGGYE